MRSEHVTAPGTKEPLCCSLLLYNFVPYKQGERACQSLEMEDERGEERWLQKYKSQQEGWLLQDWCEEIHKK